MNLTEELKRRADRVEGAIPRFMPPETFEPLRLGHAMRYAMQGGGKRLRPVLVGAAAELFPAGSADPMAAAVAVECVHTYSLIHDDLPCMDDDDLRRGRPTVHKAFDEATAVLAGDALLTLAFQILFRDYAADPSLAAGLGAELGEAAGYGQLIGGQMLDLVYEQSADATAAILEDIHARKTAAMLRASLAMGGRVGGATPEQLATLRAAGGALGMAFQIVDDILDATESSETLGKTAGKDEASGKLTFVKFHGIEQAREFAGRYTDEAVAQLRGLPGDTAFLVELVRSLTGRHK